MKSTIVLRPIPAVMLVAGVVAGAGSASAASKHSYAGPTEQSPYGPVQVTIVVTAKKITDVKATVHPSEFPSQRIEGNALPILRREVLKAQSSKVSIVSGATETSKAYITSLKGALKKAHMK